MATGTEHRRSPHARRVELLLALLVVVIAGPLVHDNGAQQASRYTLTAAIWDEHTLNLDMYAALDEPVLGVDRAVRDGSTYSDKAPLQPMLAVPFYAAYRAVGGEPAKSSLISCPYRRSNFRIEAITRHRVESWKISVIKSLIALAN